MTTPPITLTLLQSSDSRRIVSSFLWAIRIFLSSKAIFICICRSSSFCFFSIALRRLFSSRSCWRSFLLRNFSSLFLSRSFASSSLRILKGRIIWTLKLHDEIEWTWIKPPDIYDYVTLYTFGPFTIPSLELSNLASHLASSSISSNLWSFLSLISNWLHKSFGPNSLDLFWNAPCCFPSDALLTSSTLL